MYALERSKLVDQWATFRPDQKFLKRRAIFDKVVVEKARKDKEVNTVAGNGKAKVAAAAAANGQQKGEEPPTTETETINVPSEMPVFYFDKVSSRHFGIIYSMSFMPGFHHLYTVCTFRSESCM
jgi:hypothetical protein